MFGNRRGKSDAEGIDNCVAGLAGQPVAGTGGPFPVQSQVRHAEFGSGVVTDLEEDRLTVLFEEVGYRTLSLELVEDGLLRAEEEERP